MAVEFSIFLYYYFDTFCKKFIYLVTITYRKLSKFCTQLWKQVLL